MLGILLFARVNGTLQLPVLTRVGEGGGEWTRVGNVSYSLLCIICVPNENFIDISNANRYNTIVFAFWPNFGHICTAAQKTPFRPYNTVLYYTSSCV